MYINNAKYISNVSIVKIIVDVILKIRKSYYFNKLKLFAKRNKNINNLSKDLSLAKKDLHDGKFGWFFRAIGTIPVDLHAEHNKDALNRDTNSVSSKAFNFS